MATIMPSLVRHKPHKLVPLLLFQHSTKLEIFRKVDLAAILPSSESPIEDASAEVQGEDAGVGDDLGCTRDLDARAVVTEERDVWWWFFRVGL